MMVMSPEAKSILVECLDGRSRHLNLTYAKRLEIAERGYGQGIDLLDVYIQQRAQRVIVHEFSQWEDRGHLGRAKGHIWYEADNRTIAILAKHFKNKELAALLPGYFEGEQDQ